MTTTKSQLSPFDAIRMVTFDADGRAARVNRYGIGFGQSGFYANDHFPDLESLNAGLEAMLADLRRVYGTPGRGCTGRFIEEEMEIGEDVRLIRRIRFVPLLKSGKRGKMIHTINVYPIEVAEAEIERIAEAPKVPVR